MDSWTRSRPAARVRTVLRRPTMRTTLILVMCAAPHIYASESEPPGGVLVKPPHTVKHQELKDPGLDSTDRTVDVFYPADGVARYPLVSFAHGYGGEVYWFLRSTLDSMSLCMRKAAYYNAVELIYKVSLHLDNRWCAVKNLPGLIESAAAAYDRPVARRWRRALFMVRWKVRLAKWRPVFNEAWLRPGGAGEQQFAKRFQNHADAHQDPSLLP